MKLLLFFVGASILCNGVQAHDVNDYADHNYSSVDQCVKTRNERTARIKQKAAEGDPTSSPAILTHELAQQDPLKCESVFLGCDESAVEMLLVELDGIPSGTAYDMFRSHHRRQIQQVTSTGGSRGCSVKQLETLAIVARLRKSGESQEQLSEALMQLATARQQHLIQRLAWEDSSRKQELLREQRLAKSTQQTAERSKACIQRNQLSKAGTVKLGMTAADVRICGWGAPSDINRSIGTWGTHEQWVYSVGNYLYFENGVLRSIQN